MGSVLIYHHLGLGDHIMCHGIVREYCKKYDKAALFSLPRNLASVSFMYRDIPNLEIIGGDEAFIKNYLAQNGAKYDSVKIIGFEYLNRQSGEPLEKQFYKIAGVDLAKKWDGFFVKRDFEKEKALYDRLAPKTDYVFLHEDAPRNYRIDRKKIGRKYKIFEPDPKLTENLFDYCSIIEKAKEIHVIDSSFMFLIDCLAYKNPEQKLFLHRYARENEAWKFPILKKNWRILTLAKPTAQITRFQKMLDTAESSLLTGRLTKRMTRKIYRTFGWRTRSQKRGGAL